MRFTMVVLALLIALGATTFAKASSGLVIGDIPVPGWVFEKCNPYPVIAVFPEGTLIVFYNKEETGFCAALTNVKKREDTKVQQWIRAITKMSFVFLHFGGWEMKPGYESVVPGASGPVIVAEREAEGSHQRFLVGYQNGIVIGWTVNW